MAAAISSISPIQRQPLAAADRSAASQRFSRPGWDRPHSSSRTGSTPSARASARVASSRAADPLVQDAYAIFTADAVPGGGTTRASTSVPPNSIGIPTTPTAAFRVGEKVADPLAMYLSDIYTIGANLVGLPGISIPCGFTRAGLPVGLQILAPPFSEGKLLRVARMYERATDWHRRRPNLA